MESSDTSQGISVMMEFGFVVIVAVWSCLILFLERNTASGSRVKTGNAQQQNLTLPTVSGLLQPPHDPATTSQGPGG